MPTHAASQQAIQQMYINGHFCYAYKFGIITNGLSIVCNITFYNKNFLSTHPDIVIEKKSNSPNEDKSFANSKALLPVLIDCSKTSFHRPYLLLIKSTKTNIFRILNL